MKNIFKRASRVVQRKCIGLLSFVNSDLYMRHYSDYMKKIGMKLSGRPNWISNDVYFDGSDYSLISLGEGCTISREALFLTHDFSMHTVLGGGISNTLDSQNYEKLKQHDEIDKLRVLREIHVGNYSFIGARAMLLPGTNIGDNCIVGAGAIVKGVIPDNSIVIGNPAKIIANTDEWLSKKSKSFIDR